MNDYKLNAVFEKRKWVGITGLCNNHCIFCLDGNHLRPDYRTINEVEKDIIAGIEEGCTRLILSGGEATIHPEFLKIIELSKNHGYNRVQTITNGRMFSDVTFLNKAVKAGLSEITFSIHGHNSKLHNEITQTRGSFIQTIKGIRNALKANIIVNCDVVLSKKNITHLPEIMRFLIKLGIKEYDLLHIMPYGYAWENRDDLLIDPKKYLNYYREAFEIGIKNQVVMWTNRLPAQCLEGYENLIQDPYKLLDEINGREKSFNKSLAKNKRLDCYGDRCYYCCMQGLCDYVYESYKLFQSNRIITQDYDADEKIIINKKNFDKIVNRLESVNNKPTILEFPAPYHNYKEYGPDILNMKEFATIINNSTASINDNFKFKNMPKCLFKKEVRKQIVQNNKFETLYFPKDKDFNLYDCAKKYIGYLKIKSIRCKNCIYDNSCEGVFQKYIMIYGFNELEPVK
ncbi:MAG: radical SAM protein [Candidatus Cloacimonetes bacterium]|nr:radical SAM protein [Candidatus Cloacimonadota bacterium]